MLQGCALSCDDYNTYDEILDTWVGHDLNDYERRFQASPLSVMERPANRLEYKYDTPYEGYQTYYACNTWLEVDGNSGEIVSWKYEGDCYMHGYCAD